MNQATTPAHAMAAEDWSGDLGERWLAHLDRFEGMIAPAGAALLQHAAIASGERVIDVGCGAGGTTIEIARRIAPAGEALGLDISQALTAAATQRASVANVRNVRFVCADAATFKLVEQPYDRLFSRFGLMFFPRPVEAFTNLRRFLRRGARADFSVWAPARENGWVVALMEIIGRHVELPQPEPHAPGPFAFDDPVYLREVLEKAGFESTRIDTWRGQQLVAGRGATPEQAADFVLQALQFGDLLQEANPSARETARAQLVDLFAKHKTADGIAMAATAFLVTTRA